MAKVQTRAAVAEPPRSLQAEVWRLRTAADWESAARPWMRLAQTVGAPAWLSWEWHFTWWQTVAPRTVVRLLVLTNREGEWSGVLPLREGRWGPCRRWGGAALDSQRRGLLCRSEDGAAARAELARLVRERRDWDWLQVDGLAEEDATGLAGHWQSRGLDPQFGERSLQRYVALSRTGPGFAAQCGLAMLRELERRERKLRQRGRLWLEVLRDAAPAAAAFETCLQIEAQGWKGRAGTALLNSAVYTAFYRRLVRQLAASGQLRLMLLRLDAAVLAFQLGALAPGSLAGLKVGYDEAWAPFGPGKIMLLHILRHAQEEGLREYDFLGGDDPFKASWTPLARTLTHLRVFNDTRRGLALSYALSARRRLAPWRLAPPRATPVP